MQPSPNRFCAQCGAPLAAPGRFCGSCGAVQPVHQAAPVYPPPQPHPPQPVYSQPSYPHQPAYPPPGAPPERPAPSRRRQGSGCLRSCLLLVLVLALLLGSGYTYLRLRPPVSGNMKFGRSSALLNASLPIEGGELLVERPGHPLDGLRIQVQPGSYTGTQRFRLSERPVLEHQFGPTFLPLTPLIKIDNGDRYAKHPLRISVPLPMMGPGEFAMAFVYNELYGSLEALPLLELRPDELVFASSRFSEVLVAKVNQGGGEPLQVDTGFRPGQDDWPFKNTGSIVAPPGHCAGMSIAAIWYYHERFLALSEPHLNGALDNNLLGFKTPDIPLDDSWGWRFSSEVQSATDWSNYSYELNDFMSTTSDTLTWLSLAFAMQQTGEPQLIVIWGIKDGKTYGHAMVAYRIQPGRLYVYDPNYPGDTTRYIRFENGVFLPYASGRDFTAIANGDILTFDRIRFIGISRVLEWEEIGALYQKMLDGKAGQGIFPSYHLLFQTGRDKDGKLEISEFPKVLELTPDQLGSIDPDNPTMLNFGLFFDDGNADYTLDVFTPDGTITQLAPMPGQSATAGYYLLKPGVNQLGFYTQRRPPDSGLEYNDFWRVKVIFGVPDLAGEWQGDLQFLEAGGLSDFVSSALVQFLLRTGLAENETQAREMAAASVEQDPNLRVPRPLALRLQPSKTEAKPGQKLVFPGSLFLQGDNGSVQEIPTQLEYNQGFVSFQAKFGDGSTFSFTGELQGKDSLTGNFSISAWGVVKNAGSGLWQVARQP